MSEPESLRQRWESEAENWVRWARKPGHDSYWRYHREAFFSLVPEPGRLTLDIGCGEGRVARDLKAQGHRVIAADASATMVRYATEADPSMEVHVSDAAHLPFADGIADLVISFMSLQDTDDMAGAVFEAARVLMSDGRYCIAVVHPINSAGSFVGGSEGSPFVIQGDYFTRRRYSDRLERDGLGLTIHSAHRPLQDYARALEDAKFVIEAIRESTVTEEAARERAASARWRRVPLFLDLRARKR
ncbi:MAG: class I SAM-dependent methyltransferase [Candidatus Dormibacteraeota bacterium]|nr:class I SAM-dependent methyltransferase [Candidatus Dormibacteraeota bacterium]